MLKKCEVCNKVFDGKSKSKYCSEACRKNNKNTKVIIQDASKVLATNLYTMQKNNKSGHIGVSYDNTYKKWRSQIKYDKKLYMLGRYENVNDAIFVRHFAEYNFYGEILDPTLNDKEKEDIIKRIKEQKYVKAENFNENFIKPANFNKIINEIINGFKITKIYDDALKVRAKCITCESEYDFLFSDIVNKKLICSCTNNLIKENNDILIDKIVEWWEENQNNTISNGENIYLLASQEPEFLKIAKNFKRNIK